MRRGQPRSGGRIAPALRLEAFPQRHLAHSRRAPWRGGHGLRRDRRHVLHRGRDVVAGHDLARRPERGRMPQATIAAADARALGHVERHAGRSPPVRSLGRCAPTRSGDRLARQRAEGGASGPRTSLPLLASAGVESAWAAGAGVGAGVGAGAPRSSSVASPPTASLSGSPVSATGAVSRVFAGSSSSEPPADPQCREEGTGDDEPNDSVGHGAPCALRTVLRADHARCSAGSPASRDLPCPRVDTLRRPLLCCATLAFPPLRLEARVMRSSLALFAASSLVAHDVDDGDDAIRLRARSDV